MFVTFLVFSKFQNSLTSDNDQILIDRVYIERKRWPDVRTGSSFLLVGCEIQNGNSERDSHLEETGW